ncbi:class I SAM-dependent methyltransferase [Pseudomonas oryziphila]|uniref:Class I SAM-dependent methyltransferase n=1 Tax=Pseudomonas entomophila TaxID=312306 RepID=A0A3S8UH67_9PSED|nr:class I SAM-dependent methyltransferase [Pseudomonas oryziphila]AZL67616.1 class I SAM-dependent methyltransferase [Pseudomonas oryziphila]
MSEQSKHVYFSPSAFVELAQHERQNWWFRSRNALILWVMERYCARINSFLEVGCGTGFVLEAVSERYKEANIFGSEYFEEGLEFARQRVPTASFQQLDATIMSDVERFDVIGAFDVLEHIEEDEKVIENLARAITSGGVLLITVPQHAWLWSKVDEYACHVRRYSRPEIVAKVEKAGIRVQYVSSFVSLLLPLMWLSRLRARNQVIDPMSEFKIPRWLNAVLESVMNVERVLLRLGLRFPAGGSLLVVGRKA